MRLGLGYILCFVFGFSTQLFAEGLPANPWGQNTSPQAVPTNTLIDENPPAENSTNPGLNPYELLDKAQISVEDTQDQISEALQSLRQINENPGSAKAAPTAKLPSWSEMLPQIDLSAKTQEIMPQRTVSKPKASSGNDEFSKAVSDIEAEYQNMKRTTNSYYRSAVKNVHELERTAKDSVKQLQNRLK